MTTLIINEKTRKGQIILELVHELGVGKIVTEQGAFHHIPNRTTTMAIQDAQKGNTIKCDNFNDYLEKIK